MLVAEVRPDRRIMDKTRWMIERRDDGWYATGNGPDNHESIRGVTFSALVEFLAGHAGEVCESALLVDAISEYRLSDEIVGGEGNSPASELDALIVRAREIMAGDR